MSTVNSIFNHNLGSDFDIGATVANKINVNIDAVSIIRNPDGTISIVKGIIAAIPTLHYFDNFTGSTLDIGSIAGLNDAGTVFEVLWNGQQIFESTGGTTRDFTYTSTTITFTEPMDDCRIVVRVYRTVI